MKDSQKSTKDATASDVEAIVMKQHNWVKTKIGFHTHRCTQCGMKKDDSPAINGARIAARYSTPERGFSSAHEPSCVVS